LSDPFARQSSIAIELYDALSEPTTKLARLTGDVGSGKTFVALSVGSTWREAGGRCVISIGDEALAYRDLHPFLSGLIGIPAGWRSLAAKGSRSVLRVADTLGPAAVASPIFDLLTSQFKQKLDRALRAFSPTERDVLLDLRQMGRRERLLLIADNAHWWDSPSLRLLREVMSDKLAEGIPQLRSLTVLMVDSANEQGPLAPEPFNRLATDCAPLTWVLDRCTRDQFPLVLKDVGLGQDLPTEIVDALFVATGGHLKLAEQIAAFSRRQGLRDILNAPQNRLLSTLLLDRIGSFGGDTATVSEVLSRASVLGLRFDERQLRCIADDLECDIDAILGEAERVHLLDREGSSIAFSHDIVRRTVQAQLSSAQTTDNLRRFEKCLLALRPGDYLARAEALLQAGDNERGRELFALACVGFIRRRESTDRVLASIQRRFPNDDELQRFVAKIARGYESIFSGRFREAIVELEVPGQGETPLLAAERNYAASLAFLELETTEGVEEAVRLLSFWRPREGEPELAIRFLLLLQQAQVLSAQFEEARRTENEVERRLVARARFDAGAATLLQIQNRRAGAIMGPEVAVLRIAESVRYFREGLGGEPLDRNELVRSLNNLAAEKLRLGDAQGAWEAACEAEQLVGAINDRVPRLDVLGSNLAMAGIRSMAISSSKGIAWQRAAIASPEGGTDKFIHRCNLAGYLLLERQDVEANELIDELSEELAERSVAETYLHFYLGALDVARLAFSDQVSSALQRHNKMQELVYGLNWPNAAYVRRRHDLLPSVLTRLSPDRNVADCQLAVERPSEIGPAWSYYSRVVVVSELSYWLDS
jgi:hypothetical protein